MDNGHQQNRPRLAFLQDRVSALDETGRDSELEELVESPVLELGIAEDAGPSVVTVLVQFTDLSPLEEAGLRVRSVAGDVAVGEVDVTRLDRLASTLLCASRGRVHFSTSSTSRSPSAGEPHPRGDARRTRDRRDRRDNRHGHRLGEPVVPATQTDPRVLAIWDQGLVPQGGEASPTNFGYGVESAPPRSTPPSTAPSRGPSSAITTTWASTERMSPASRPATRRRGRPSRLSRSSVSHPKPISSWSPTPGPDPGRARTRRSADTVDAVRLHLRPRRSWADPAVINQSQGDDVGAHDGTIAPRAGHRRSRRPGPDPWLSQRATK